MNSYKEPTQFESQTIGIPFEEMVCGRKRCNGNNYDTCYSSSDRLDIVRQTSATIKKIRKSGYLALSSTYLQSYN